MHIHRSLIARALLTGTAVLALAASAAAHAGLPALLPFEGTGNVVVFDPVAGSGGWVGSITDNSVPAAPQPLSFASVVTFSFDAATNLLTGQFEFTDAATLGSSLFGTLTGNFTDPTSTLSTGGQWAIDYSVTGGSGAYAGAQGFGLSFLTFDPQSKAFDNYSEIGALVVAVPEPSTWWLMGAGLGLLGWTRRRGTAPRN